MPSNKRIYYAVQTVSVAADGTTTFLPIHGVQSLSMNTTFNLDQVFEFGQSSIYDNVEGTPDVEVTIEKVLDGYAPVFLHATKLAASSSLQSRGDEKCLIALTIYDDSAASASGRGLAECVMSGMFVSSVGYTFPVDGNFSENITLVGNHKVWFRDPLYSGAPTTQTYFNATSTDFSNNLDTPFAGTASGGVNRREDLLLTPTVGTGTVDSNGQYADPDCTILPRDVYGINTYGANALDSANGFGAHLQNISVNVDLNREDLFELGRRTQYHRFANYPVEVTTEIEVIATSGDMISATEAGIIAGVASSCPTASNLRNNSIRIATCEGLRINLGTKNKMASVSQQGGDTGGGNVTVTYTYTNFNDFTVTHRNSPGT